MKKKHEYPEVGKVNNKNTKNRQRHEECCGTVDVTLQVIGSFTVIGLLFIVVVGAGSALVKGYKAYDAISTCAKDSIVFYLNDPKTFSGCLADKGYKF